MRNPVAIGIGLLLTLSLAGCPEAPAPEAPQTSQAETPKAAPAEAPEAPEPAQAEAEAPKPEAKPTETPTWRSGLVRPFHPAPALDLDERNGLGLRVDLYSGRASVVEVDGTVGPIELRRVRSTGEGRVGLFGRGWLTEVESFIEVREDGLAILSRPQGFTIFAEVEKDRFVSSFGDVEVIDRDVAGYLLTDITGRLTRFDHDGRFVESAPGYRVSRSPQRLRLSGNGSVVTIDLDRNGRATRVLGAGVDLSYAYEGDELTSVTGTRPRTYSVDAEGRLISVSCEESLELVHGEGNWIASASRGAWKQVYRFTRGESAMARVWTGTPVGAYDYVRTESGWTVATPDGAALIVLDERLRIKATLNPEGELDDLKGLPNMLPSGAALEHSFDDDGRLSSIQAEGVKESFEYDDQGRVSEHTTPDGRTTRFAYDEQGRVVAERRPEGRVSYERDAIGRVTGIETPGKRSWRVAWKNGEIAGLDGPMGLVVFEPADADGVSLQHDASGRVISRRLHVETGTLRTIGGEQTRTLWFDAQGNVIKAVSGDRQTLSIRYPNGRPKHVLTRAGKDTQVRLDYEDTTERHAITTPWGVYDHTYEGGLLTKLESPAGTFRFEYDEHAKRTKTIFPNGVEASSRHDVLGRVVSERVLPAGEGDPILLLEAEWNERHERSADRRDGQETRYGYDRAGRLARVAGEDTTHYRYDADGNRISTRRGHDDAEAATFDRRGRIVEDGPSSFRHDASGRILERKHPGGVDRFAYDGLGRLAMAARAGKPEVRYTYDAEGRLASRTKDGQTTQLIYEGERLIAEIGPESKRVYVYGPGIDEALAYSDDDGETWTFLHANDLGHVLAYTDGEGKRVAQASFTPFGEVTQAPGGDRPTLFAGRAYDADAAVYPMRMRNYDPSLGRFLTADPSFLEGGLNAYTYVENKPLDYIDPTGMWSVPGWVTRTNRMKPYSRKQFGKDWRSWHRRLKNENGIIGNFLHGAVKTKLGALRDTVLSNTANPDQGALALEVFKGLDRGVDNLGSGLKSVVGYFEDLVAPPLTPAERKKKSLARKKNDDVLAVMDSHRKDVSAPITLADIATDNVRNMSVKDYFLQRARYNSAKRAASARRVVETLQGLAEIVRLTPTMQATSVVAENAFEIANGATPPGEALASIPGDFNDAMNDVINKEAPKLLKGALQGLAEIPLNARHAALDGDPEAAGKLEADIAMIALTEGAGRMIPRIKPKVTPKPTVKPPAKPTPPPAPKPPAKPTAPTNQSRGFTGALDDMDGAKTRKPTDPDGPTKPTDPDGPTKPTDPDGPVPPKNKPTGKRGCFLAGTLVATTSGFQTIETIQKNDLVLSRDDSTGEIAYKRVVRLFRGHTDRVVHLKIAKSSAVQRGRGERHRVGEESGGSGEGSDEPPLTGRSQADDVDDEVQTLRCTTEHPFWVVGRGWVRSGQLKVGDRLVGSKGEDLVVVGHEIRDEEADHYNFHVEDFNTYFVAERADAPFVWVHNKAQANPLNPPIQPRPSFGHPDFYRPNKIFLPKQGNLHFQHTITKSKLDSRLANWDPAKAPGVRPNMSDSIKVVSQDGKFYVVDGNHRMMAAMRRGEALHVRELSRAEYRAMNHGRDLDTSLFTTTPDIR